MKTSKKQKTTKLALCAGAAALASLTPQAHAQSSSDSLINKLEQKGILTSDEAKQLRVESQQDFNNSLTNNMDKAFGAMTGMPSWVTGYKISGDFRGRVDDMTGNSALTDRLRFRYRLRVGLQMTFKDDMQVGFQIASDEPQGNNDTGNPLSNNTTLSQNGSKKMLYIDQAYAKWTPVNNDTWMGSGTIGKMSNPFQQNPSVMVWDPDYTPEGAALQGKYHMSDNQSIDFTGAAFVADEVKGSASDPFILGAQAIWNGNWTKQMATALGVSYYNIVNVHELGTAYDGNTGNTLNGAGGTGSYAESFHPVVVSGYGTYKLDSFPLYQGAFPIMPFGDYMNNSGASSNNEGWDVGVKFGKAGKKGNWDIAYRYQRLEADAWWDQVVNDDNIAFKPGTGVVSGTNIKGHAVQFNYSILDSLTFTFTGYFNNLVNNTSPNSSSAMHLMADLMWKF